MVANVNGEEALSKSELLELTSGLDSFGEMLIMMGKIAKLEKAVSHLDTLMNKLFQAENRALIFAMETNPELMDKAEDLALKWEALAGKDPMDLLPDEQIELGTSFKDFSRLFIEVVDRLLQDETPPE